MIYIEMAEAEVAEDMVVDWDSLAPHNRIQRRIEGVVICV